VSCPPPASHQPKLFLEYLDHFEKVKSFYAHPPAMQEVSRAARKLNILKIGG